MIDEINKISLTLFVLLVTALPASASISFTAEVNIAGKKVTETVNVDTCGFSSDLYKVVENVGTLPPNMLQGSDPAISVHHGDRSCYLYKKYVVSTLWTDEVSCALVELNGGKGAAGKNNERWHFFFKDPFKLGTTPAHFAGIYKNYFFSDDSCCPGPSTVDIYDLETGLKIFRIYGSNLSIDINESITYWIEEEKRATHKECPDKTEWVNSPPEIERRVELNLGTLSVSKTAEMRCAGRQ